MRLDLPQKMLRKWASRWLADDSRSAHCRGLFDNRCALCAVGFQFFQLQLKLLDLPLDLLRPAPELHALQLGDEQFQVLDLVIARE